MDYIYYVSNILATSEECLIEMHQFTILRKDDQTQALPLSDIREFKLQATDARRTYNSIVSKICELFCILYNCMIRLLVRRAFFACSSPLT